MGDAAFFIRAGVNHAEGQATRCRGGYSTIDGQTVRDALCPRTDVPVTDDRAASRPCAGITSGMITLHVWTWDARRQMSPSHEIDRQDDTGTIRPVIGPGCQSL